MSTTQCEFCKTVIDACGCEDNAGHLPHTVERCRAILAGICKGLSATVQNIMWDRTEAIRVACELRAQLKHVDDVVMELTKDSREADA